MMRRLTRTSLARFSAGPKGLPYYNDSQVETPEIIREDIQPEGKWPYFTHRILKALINCKVPMIREAVANYASIKKLDNGNLHVDFPKLTPNSVWLYHGGQSAESVRKMMTTTPAYFAIFCLISFNPVFYFLIWSIMYVMINSVRSYKRVNRLVVRMDYMPNIKKICVTKVGIFGNLRTSFWELSEFKTISGFQDRSRYPVYWMYNKYTDPSVIYQNTRTGEKLFFERNGMWNWEGISHHDLQHHQIAKDPENYAE